MNAENICPKCGKTFSCGANTGQCWCCELPHIMPLDEEAANCYCPDCLQSLIREKEKALKPNSDGTFKEKD